MNGRDIRIKSISSGSTNMMVGTDEGVFVLDNRKDDHTYHALDDQRGIWIRGIFRADDFSGETFSNNSRFETPDVGMKTGKVEYEDVLQIDKYSFLRSPEALSATMTQIGDEDIVDQVCVALYDAPSSYDVTEFLSLSSPRVALSGLPFSYGGIVPLEGFGFSFDEGVIFVDSFNLKNDLNPFYDNEIELSEFAVTLSNTRRYIRSGFNGDVLWMTFRPGHCFSGEVSGSVPNGSSTIVNIVSSRWNDSPINSFEFLETVRGLNTPGDSFAHKSNVFSIELRDTGLNEGISDVSLREKVQNVVERSVRRFVKESAPAHTQLWKIEWVGV